MEHVNIATILKEIVAGNEELEKLEGRFRGIDVELDSMIEHKIELEKIIKKAKERVYMVFDGHQEFISRKWDEIEGFIEHNLRNYKTE